MLRAITFLVLTYLASSLVQDVPPVRPDDKHHKKFAECTTPDRPKPDVKGKKNIGLCGKAISLPKPEYPKDAKQQKVSGVVSIEIVIDEEGDPIWAKAIDGPPLLQEPALKAACLSRHSPEKISGQPVKVNRVITYNFVSN